MDHANRRLVLAAALAMAAGVWLNATPADARTLCTGEKGLNLRSGPSVKHKSIGRLPANACGVRVVGKCQTGWCEVGLGDRRGWADTRLVTVHEGKPPVAAKATTVRPVPRAERETQRAPTVRRAEREERLIPPPVRRAERDDRPYPPPMRRVDPEDYDDDLPPLRWAERDDPRFLPPVRLPGVFAYAPPPFRARPVVCVAGIWPGDTLRVRAGPGNRHPAIWEIEAGACGVSVRGGCARGWCPVRYRGVYGWVNAAFLRPIGLR